NYVSSTTTAGSSSHSGSTVTFNLGTIAVNGTVTMTVTAQAMEDGTLTNSASVTATSFDSNTANNSAPASTNVIEPPINVTEVLTRVEQKSVSNAVVATFTQAGGIEPASAFKATINWGDGKTSPGTITQSGAPYTVTGSPRYFSTPRHTISTTVSE